MKEILKEAQLRYPVGTVFYGNTLEGFERDTFVVKYNLEIRGDNKIDHLGTPYIYKNGVWATIVKPAQEQFKFIL